jgi:F-type H+-transporting ATPase subunit epsilon
MSSNKDLQNATQERLIASVSVDYTEISGKDGYLGILPGQAALLSELGTGALKYVSQGKTDTITVSGGYVEVRDNHVRVLADRVE